MSLPPEVDRKIRERFVKLEQAVEALVFAEREKGYLPAIYESEFHAVKLNFISLIQLLSTRTNLTLLLDNVTALNPDSKQRIEGERLVHDSRQAAQLAGLIRGLRNDYESGMLDSLERLIEANVAADYLGQAENLLKEGQFGKYDHVPAAVLTGAILEDALRRLCQRQNPPINLDNAKGEPKTLNPLIEDLKKANLFNELKAKQLRSWADIRNAAAHGRFDDFTRQDVEQMLAGVQNFLADYL